MAAAATKQLRALASTRDPVTPEAVARPLCRAAGRNRPSRDSSWYRTRSVADLGIGLRGL